MTAELGPRSGRIYRDLRTAIEEESLPVGAVLPSRQALARQYGVAVMTVGQAVELLEREGFVESRIGSGTYVRSRMPKDTSSAAPLQSVIDASPLAVVTFGPDGIVSTWNHAAERIFGWTAAEAIGRAHPAVAPGAEGEYRDLARRVGLGETISGVEPRRQRKDGTPVYVRLALAPVRDADGRIMGAVSFAEDITAQREREATLRRQEELLELAQEAVLVRDLDSAVIRYWSAGAETLYGWSRDEAIGRVSHELLQTRFPETLSRIKSKLIETGRWTGELEHRTRDGRCIVVESRWALHRDESGEPVGALEVNRDVTTQRDQAALLRRQEASFRAMFDRATIGMGLASMDGRLEETNQALQRFLGYSGEELCELSFRDFTHPHDLDADRELVGELVSGHRDRYQLEKRYIRKDGRVIWGHLTVSLIRDESGKPARAAVMIEDITARKLAEADARAGELRYRNLVESAHDLIFTLDPDGFFTSVNRRAEEVLGYSRDEASRLTIMQVAAPEHRASVRRMIADILAGSGGMTLEIDLVRKTGQAVRVEVAGAAVTRDGAPVGVQVIARADPD